MSRIHLSRRLRELREAIGYTQAQVGQELDWSTSKVLRIEAGTSRVQVTDLRALLTHYQVSDPTVVDELVELARDSRTSDWHSSYRPLVTAQFYTFLDYEAAAIRSWLFTSSVVPALLRSAAYSRLHAELFVSDEDVRERMIAITAHRQRILTADSSPEMSFVLDMAVLLRDLGGHEVTSEQLHHLHTLAGLPHVTIRIVPFDTGAHPGMQGSGFVGFDFAQVPSMVYINDRTRDVVPLTKPTDVATARRDFESISKCARPPEATPGVLATALAVL